MSGKYVLDGAKIKCPLCSKKKGKLKATSNKVKLQDKPAAVEGDNGKQNLQFQGNCTHPQFSGGPPPPCKSVIKPGKWQKTSETKFDEQKALVEGSTIMCQTGKVPITIADTTQTATPTNLQAMYDAGAPVPAPADKDALKSHKNADPNYNSYVWDEPVDTELKYEKLLRFVAHLRRPSSYDGQFGFDWMRPNYKSICFDYDQLEQEYTPFPLNGQTYYVPWLSMFPGQEGVKLILKAEIINDVSPEDDDIIKLPAQDSIRFEPAKVKVSEANGKEITVFCDSPVQNNMDIELLDKNDRTVGKINIFRNANHKQLHFDIIPVRLLRSGSTSSDVATIESSIDTGFGLPKQKLAGDLQKLEKYLNNHSLNQALLQCSMRSIRDVVIDKSEWIAKGLIVTNKGKVFKGPDILDKFYEEFKKQHPQIAQERGIVMFLSPLGKKGAGGEGKLFDIDAKQCVIYQSNLWHKQSFAHEIGHLLGLKHSFMKFDQVTDYNKYVKEIHAYFDKLEKMNVSEAYIAEQWNKVAENYAEARGRLQLYYNYYEGNIGFDKKKTKNFMDYVRKPISFWQHQWVIMQTEIKEYY